MSFPTHSDILGEQILPSWEASRKLLSSWDTQECWPFGSLEKAWERGESQRAKNGGM